MNSLSWLCVSLLLGLSLLTSVHMEIRTNSGAGNDNLKGEMKT